MVKKSVSSDVDSVVLDISSMRVRGALNIAIEASKALGGLVRSLEANPPLIQEQLRIAGDKLKGARPTAVSLPNSVDYINYLAAKNLDLGGEEYKKQLVDEINEFIKELACSLDEIAEIGSNVIEENDRILTHCNSDTVVHILKRAHAKGKRFMVYATETRPRLQGHITAKELIDEGIPVTLIVDSAACLTMHEKKIDKVLVGADTVYVDGDVINKIGTSQIALCAREHDIDFIVAVESIKFSPQSLMGSVVKIEERSLDEVWDRPYPGLDIFNPAFDVTDSRLVEKIITELGLMPPEAVYQVVKEKFSWEL
ncbi:MAG: ribose 1,5-bisphosphate isomerase [Candidatus Altiarchaeales archaeon ex4484_96]|nr:MAG: ribose 1,5-bisphosphate isomerase [Candidatus Altiarchaeales archaeon ex4484_96]